MKPNHSYQNIFLNNYANFVQLYGIMQTDDFREAFISLQNEDFSDIDFAEMQGKEANELLNLLNICQATSFQVANFPEVTSLISIDIFRGANNVIQKLLPIENLLKGISTGQLTNAEAEHQILSKGVNIQNQKHKNRFLDSL